MALRSGTLAGSSGLNFNQVTHGGPQLMRSARIELPPYLVVKSRKKGPAAHYFQVPRRLRPDDWPPTLRLSGNLAEAIEEAKDAYKRMEAERSGAPLANRHGTIPWLIESYEQTETYRKKSPKTKTAHAYCARILTKWSKKGRHPQVSRINRPAILKFLSALDETPSTRNHVASYLRTLLHHARDKGLIETNPATELRLEQPEATIRIWDIEGEFERVVEWLDQHGRSQVATALWIARAIGQREGDVLSLQEPRDYRDGMFRFWQEKTKTYMTIPAPAGLPKRLEARPDGQLLLVANEVTGVKYNPRTLNKWLRRATRALQLDDLLFMHLRHTCVVEMARAECTEAEIASITGHSLRTVGKILKHYLPRDSVVARNAISKLDAYREQELDTRVGRQLDTSAK